MPGKIVVALIPAVVLWLGGLVFIPGGGIEEEDCKGTKERPKPNSDMSFGLYSRFS